MKAILAALTLSIVAGTVPAAGAVLFQDNFSADSIGFQKTTLVNFNVLNETNIDIGLFSASCSVPPAKCLDTRGSGNNSSGDIETKSSFALTPGISYNLSFSMANTSGTNSVRVRIGSALDQTFTAPNLADGTYNIPFTASAQTSTLRFTDIGEVDNGGLNIGNIILTSDAAESQVPEPSTIGLLAVGLGSFALFRIRASI